MADEELSDAAVPGICSGPQTPSIPVEMVHPIFVRRRGGLPSDDRTGLD
jgi:hypothetical protein